MTADSMKYLLLHISGIAQVRKYILTLQRIEMLQKIYFNIATRLMKMEFLYINFYICSGV